MDSIKYKELTWGVFATSAFVLGIVNIYYPISSWKIFIVAISAFLMSIYQLLEGILGIYTSEHKATNELNEVIQILNLPTEKIKIRTRLRIVKVLTSCIYILSLLVLIVGLFFELEITNIKVSNTISLLSYGIIFMSMCIKDRVSKEIHRYGIILRDFEKIKKYVRENKVESDV